jgi:hypothetical protein
MVLNSLGPDEIIEVDIEDTQEEIVEYMTRRGKKTVFLQRFKN